MSEGCRNRRHLRLTPFSTPGDDEYEQRPPAAEGEKEPTESSSPRNLSLQKARAALRNIYRHLLWKLCYRLHCHISGYFADTKECLRLLKKKRS